MPDLAELIVSVKGVIQDTSYSISDIITRLNDAVEAVTAGVFMPNRRDVSPPLPELYQSDIIATTVNAYADLPATYQRGLFYVLDSSGEKVGMPRGGNYYDFMLFLNNSDKRDLTETGAVHTACVKGTMLYYQGIPSSSADLTVMFYRKPVDMAIDQAVYNSTTISFAAATGNISDSGSGLASFTTDGGLLVSGSTLNDGYYTVSAVDVAGAYITVNEGLTNESAGSTVSIVQSNDEPDGLPVHLAKKLVAHYVCKEIFGEGLEDTETASGTAVKYHTGKFYEAMENMVLFIGEDGEPLYYGDSGFIDGGICD